MKKNFMAIALCLVCALFAACASKEQKAAVEYLKESMKSPSSFNVISVDAENKEVQISYDTLYHVKKCYGDNFYGIRTIDSVLVDSIKVWRIEYPAHTEFFIEYDAANSFGAMIRDTEFVYYVDAGNIFFSKEYYGKYFDEKIFDHQESYNLVFSSGVNRYIEENAWVYPYELGIR